MKKYLKSSLVLMLLLSVSCTSVSNSEESSANKAENIQNQISEDTYKNWVEVGKIEDGVAILTADKNNLIESLNQNLYVTTGKSTRVNDVSIERIDDFFYLLFRSKKQRVTFYVQKSKDSNILRAAATTVCTTSECTQEPLGCIPKYDITPAGQDGIGTCTPCANGGKCTKTVSGKSLISN
ncbi:hypothetical protein OAB20_05350 [Winogradskyella sp.]|nr:hypothetical protein [Winogradskyella sp.]MDC1504588.1 hypothetical protein [Winogradskyella sp.]